MKFKVGDLVKNISEGRARYGLTAVVIWVETNRIGVDYKNCGSPKGKQDENTIGTGSPDSYQLINKNNIMTTVMNKIKELLRKEPEATFVKAGFMDENENLTEGGKEALQYVLWEANKAALKDLADKVVAEDEKKAKKD